jgi:fructose-bisphosphate aldolase class II
MALVTLRQALDEAAKKGLRTWWIQRQQYGASAGHYGGCKSHEFPVILQASRGARKYANDNFLYHLMLAANELYPEIPIVLHQDHRKSRRMYISS